MNLIPGVDASSQALSAEKLRMELIAQNIANANTTQGPDGKPYSRKMAVFETLMNEQQGTGRGAAGVRIAGIADDPNPGELIYNPAHPHANAEGFLQMPNVQMAREMVDLISSSRAYEANLKAVGTGQQMARQALAIGK